MSQKPGKEAQPNFKTPWPVKIFGVPVIAAAAIWFGNNSGAIQEIEPITIPKNTERIEKQNSIARVFVLRADDAGSVFCGKVRLRLQDDYDVPKTITPLKGDMAKVECDTVGFDIPVNRFGQAG